MFAVILGVIFSLILFKSLVIFYSKSFIGCEEGVSGNV